VRQAFIYLTFAVTGFFWTAVYVEIIRQGFRDRSHGMPIFAMGANISWEFYFSVVEKNYSLLPAFVLDIVIAAQCIAYAKHDLAGRRVARYAGWIVVLIMVVSYLGVMRFIEVFEDSRGWYSGFGINAVMSLLFIAFLQIRRDLKGQSLRIGVFKFLGSLGAFGLALLSYPSDVSTPFTLDAPDRYYPMAPLMFAFGCVMVLFDVIYIALLVRRMKRLGVPVLARFAPRATA
jgi:hypothetical protein